MSRIIVKNIPDYLDEKRLKQHIGAHSGNNITDVKIVRRPDGTSRRFGFIGFKEENDAIEAQKYFDKSFIDTARINVGIAKAINDEELQKQKALRRGQGRDTAAVSNGNKGGQKDETKASSSSKSISFEEFMEVMKPRSKRKISNTEDADAKLDPAAFVEKADPPTKKKSEKSANKKQKVDTIKEEKDDHEEDVAMPDAAVNDEGLTDLEYMYKRMKKTVGADLENKENEKAFEQSDDEEGPSQSQEKLASENVAEEEEEDEVDEREARRQERQRIALEKKAKKDEEDTDSIMESARLFVRNLSFDTTEEDLEEYFSQFGQVSQAHIPLDKSTKKAKGIAFVKFNDPSQALSAFRAVDGHTFQGRLLHVLPAANKGESASDPATLKGKKKQEMKANAMKDFNWNTLYMSSDAVASSVAARLGLDKSDILNPQQGDQDASVSPAVRLALAETSVINETRDFLEAEGINVDAFEGEQQSKRSDKVILVKNIPYGTGVDILQAMFEKHGAVERTIMPPSGTIAIVEMQVPGEAKVAFRSLAYKRLGNSVLYLEKAPTGIISNKAGTSSEKSKSNQVQETLSSSTPITNTENASAGATLYIKNLSFSTTDDRLASAFGKMPDVTFVRIQKRSVKQRDGRGEVKLSMGFGFVGFQNMESARTAQKVMDKTMLDGHILSVTLSKRGHDADDDAVAAELDRSSKPSKAANEINEERTTAPSTKLIVKNLAFQATKKEVRALFAAHGKLKSVRVPRKALSAGGGTAAGVRGFGFVEFVNKVEALNAYRALRHSHLLGRHLVLEWDVEGSTTGAGLSESSTKEQANSIERLRQKAASQANASQSSQGAGAAHKREKLRLNEEDIRKAARDEQRKAVDNDDDDEEDDEEE